MFVLYLVARIVSALLWILEIAMIARAVISWIPALDSQAWTDIFYVITDPIVLPVRAFFDRFEVFRNSPIDFSFIIAWLLLCVVQVVISNLTAFLL